jgi:hypothetical protein
MDVSPVTTSSASNTPSDDSPVIGDLPQRVLLDSFHAMKRVTDHIPAHHPHKMQFSQAFRDAMFVVDPSDKAKVQEFLRNSNKSFEAAYQENSDWIQRRVRRVIPSKESLSMALKRVRDEYSGAKYNDLDTGIPLLSEDALKAFDRLIKDHAEKV